MIYHDCLIIGGGASGIMAALVAKDLGKDVAIIEGTDRIGKKILTTGNGRCNISNINIDSISIRFPTPIYLVLGNTNEQIQNSQNIIEFVTSYYFPDDPTGQTNNYDRELQKAKFKKRLAKQHFLQTMDWQQFDKIFDDILIESNATNSWGLII